MGVLAQLARKTYMAYIHSNPNCPCTKKVFFVHTLGPQFFMYEKSVFRTHTCEAILHVRKTNPAYIHSTTNEERVGLLHPPGGPPKES